MFNKLKKDLLSARKEGNHIKKDLLSVIISEASKNDKAPSDELCIATVKKLLKSNSQIKEALCNTTNVTSYGNVIIEEEILNSYLPKMLSEEELYAIIRTLIENGADNVGKVMKDLKVNFKNFDSKIASDIAKKELTMK